MEAIRARAYTGNLRCNGPVSSKLLNKPFLFALFPLTFFIFIWVRRGEAMVAMFFTYNSCPYTTAAPVPLPSVLTDPSAQVQLHFRQAL